MTPTEIIKTIKELHKHPNLVTLFFINELKIPLVTSIKQVDIVDTTIDKNGNIGVITIKFITTLDSYNTIIKTMLNALLYPEYRINGYHTINRSEVVFYINKNKYQWKINKLN